MIKPLLERGDQLIEELMTQNQGYLKQSDYILTYNYSQRCEWTLVLVKSGDKLLSPVKVVGRLLMILGVMFMMLGITMVVKLADMLRYILDHEGTMVSLREELNYAQIYLDLKKERYEDHFQYHIEVNEYALSFEVPRLVLQPLLENCFHHAFQLVAPPWNIHISIKRTPDVSWLIEVKDWGMGFDSEVLRDLKWRMAFEDMTNADQLNQLEQSTEVQGSIGLFNTLVRLKLAFGKQAFFEILNNEPTGTVVRIGRRSV